MIVKHVSENAIKVMHDEELIDFIDQSINVIRKSLCILEALKDTEEGDIDEDDELEILEDCFANDIKAILIYKSASASVYGSINFYMNEIYNVILNNNKNLQDIVDSGVYVDEKWARVLKYENERIIGGLCYVLWFDFGMDKFLETMNSDQVIDAVVQGYADKKGLSVSAVVDQIEGWKRTYKFKLLVFDEYPEKEDEFIKIMGPYLGGMDSHNLTVELVDKVLSGDLSPIELFEMMQENNDILE